MRQPLNLTVDSECEYCKGTGISKRGKDRLCECVSNEPQEDSLLTKCAAIGCLNKTRNIYCEVHP